MSKIESGQVSASAAEIYEQFYLPALFLEWTPRMADAARVEAGQRVLDVACGTGVLARALVERVGPRGSVVGLDINEGMLAVARRKGPAIEWRQGAAEAALRGRQLRHGGESVRADVLPGPAQGHR
jgi:ubiquinone/menaquinone biosynthesis C-methylase UbiE